MKLYADQKHSTYRIALLLDISPNRLYHYAKGRIDIEVMPAGLLFGIAEIEDIDGYTLYNKMLDYRRDNNEKKGTAC